jgi:cytochrome c5
MTKAIRSQVAMAIVAVSLAGVLCLAQSAGEATYKAKCQSCHGATGTPSAGMAKAMGVKPVNDPAIKKLTAEQMFAAVKNGKGKMKPVAGLTDAQIRAAVIHFRSFLNPQPLPPGSK